MSPTPYYNEAAAPKTDATAKLEDEVTFLTELLAQREADFEEDLRQAVERRKSG